MRYSLLIAYLLSGCGSSGVQSNQDAQKAYLGLDASVDKAITLGFNGFNTAQSANINPQTASGSISGTMTVTGQVDQGASANKGMRLMVSMTGYSDDGKITYNTSPRARPPLNMMLRNIPTGTLDGTLAGAFSMTGQETGAVT